MRTVRVVEGREGDFTRAPSSTNDGSLACPPWLDTVTKTSTALVMEMAELGQPVPRSLRFFAPCFSASFSCLGTQHLRWSGNERTSCSSGARWGPSRNMPPFLADEMTAALANATGR